jgi:hypothetical protein
VWKFAPRNQIQDARAGERRDALDPLGVAVDDDDRVGVGIGECDLTQVSPNENGFVREGNLLK